MFKAYLACRRLEGSEQHDGGSVFDHVGLKAELDRDPRLTIGAANWHEYDSEPSAVEALL